MDTTTFAQKIKAKYPAYQAVDDATLVNKFLEKYPVYKSQVNVQSEIGADISQTKQAIGEATNTALNKFEAVNQLQATGQQGSVRSALQKLGIGAGYASNVAGEAIIGAGKALLPQSAETAIQTGVEKAVTPIVQSQPVQNIISKYEELKTVNPKLAQDIDSILGLGQLALDVAGVGVGAKGAKVAGKAGMEAVQTGAEQVAKGATKAVGTVGEILQKSPDAIAKFVSPDIDKKFKTALQRATKEDVDSMENIVKGALENADNPTAFEIVGDKLSDATEQAFNQVKSLSQQKKNIISQAKYGNVDFTKETGRIILDINKQLKDSQLAKSFISRLKQVKTKLDADNVIDELQDVLYKGNKDMTIPVGSKEDRLLKGFIGKYNGSLKESLPASYRKINDQISERLNNLELLNKSLGEVVDGVPIKGASLIKQYFSPSGTKAKELFEFIKKNTGYDVGKDAVLAKYMSEIYGESRAKSLLQGVPTTAQGTLDKLLEFTLNKTGVSGIAEKVTRKGSVLKARDIAK